MGDHTVEAYSSIGLVTVLYVVVRVSFVFPHVVEVSAFRMLRVLFALSVVCLMCELKVIFGSNVSPSILGVLVVGSVVWSMVSVRVSLYSAGSGVKRVVMVLSALMIKSLSFVH